MKKRFFWYQELLTVSNVKSPKCIVNSENGLTSGVKRVEIPALRSAQFQFRDIRMLSSIQSLVSIALVIVEACN